VRSRAIYRRDLQNTVTLSSSFATAQAHTFCFALSFFILFRFASISFCFVSILFCFVLQLGKDLELNWSDLTGVTPIFLSKKKENI